MRKPFLIAAALASIMPAFAADPSPAAGPVQAEKAPLAGLGLTALQAKNHIEALRLFSAGADQGDPLSTLYLAGMYARGEGVQRDGVRAVALYRHAADAADATPLSGSTVSGQAMYALAIIYQRGARDVRIDESEAARWYRRWTATVDPRVMARFPLPGATGSACPTPVGFPVLGFAPGEFDSNTVRSELQAREDRGATCAWQRHAER